MKNISLLVFIFTLTCSIATAQDFLLINPDVQTAGMGDVSVSMPANAYAFYNNGAAPLFSASSLQAGVSYSPWLRDLADGHALISFGGYFRCHPKHVVSLGGRFYREPRVEADEFPDWEEYPFIPKNENNEPIATSFSSFRPSNSALSLGYGYRLTATTGIALTVSYVHSALGDLGKAHAVDFSLSAYTRLPIKLCNSSELTLGIQWANAGFTTGDYSYKQPQQVKLGAALNLPFCQTHQLLGSIDLGYQYAPSDDHVFGASLGAQYLYREHLAVRSGYHITDGNKYNFGTVGLGVLFWHLQADASYLVASTSCPWRNTYRIGLSFIL